MFITITYSPLARLLSKSTSFSESVFLNMIIYAIVGKVFLLFFRGSGLILFIAIDAFFGFTVLNGLLPSVDFSFATDTLLEVSHLCLLVSSAALISLLLTTWKMKMKNPCKRVIDDFDKRSKIKEA